MLCISLNCIVLYCHPNICDIASKTKKFRFIPEIFGNLLKCTENDLQVRRTREIIKGRESPIFLYLCLMHYFIYLFFCLTRCAGSNTHSYKKRAKIITEVLNSVENVKCNEVAGAMYAFPRITLPKQAIEAATVSSFVSGPDF